MNEYILSVDNGLTTTKAVIFSMDGRQISTSLVKSELINSDDLSEIEMDVQWKNTVKAITDVIEKSGIDPSQIIGIGNSGHGAGLYMLGRSGEIIRNAVSSMDSRAVEVLEKWDKQGLDPYDKIHHKMWPGQPIPILNWLKENEPETYNKIDKIFMAKDWIKYKLTGEFSTEYSDSSNSGLVNLTTRSYDSELMARFGVEEMYNKIPKLYKSTDIVGYISKEASRQTGLKEGTPVTGGLLDLVACALGSGVYDNQKYSLIAGTWNINSGIEEKLLEIGETVKCHLFADINKYMYVESSATSAVNLEWFVVNVIKGLEQDKGNGSIYKRIDELVEKVKPQESNILYTPFLHKSHLTKSMNGSFIGIKANHSLGHMLRAIFEGVAFAHLKHIRNLQKDGIKANTAVLSGGASNSDVWCQIFADTLNMEVITTKASQEGALGTAICTAVATGMYKNFEEAVKNMVKSKKRYIPRREINQIYMNKYKRFEDIIQMFDKTHGN